MNYIPSPISFEYNISYAALANSSGRMQYYRAVKNGARLRISRNEFVDAYNNSDILAVRPIQTKQPVFQLEFFVKQ